MTKWVWGQIAILAIVLTVLVTACVHVGLTPIMITAWAIWGAALVIVIAGLVLNLRKHR